jgi:plastocyanin
MDLASQEDKRVSGAGGSNEASEETGAGRWAGWPLDRILVIAGFVATVLAGVILGSGDPSLVGPILILLLPGIVFTGLLLWRPRPTFYLLAGLANSVLAITTIPFGLFGALANPLLGPVYSAVVLTTLSLVLALPAGLLGFRRGRAGLREPNLAEGIRSLQGFAVIAIVSLSIGAIAAGSLAYQNVTARQPSVGPVYDFPVVMNISILASNSRFSPAAFNLTASVVTKITILNEDDAPHTFTYTINGTTYSHDLMGSSTTQFYVQFTRPGMVPFSSVLTPDVGMNGTMRIVSP